MKLNLICFLTLFLVCSTKIVFSQQFYNIGLSYDMVINSIKKTEKLMTKKSNSKIFQHSYETGTITTTKNQNIKYIKQKLVKYTLPMSDFTDFYYFNQDGICDSIILNENKCFGCCYGEDTSSVMFYSNKWKKLTENEMISEKLHEISSTNPNQKNNKVAYLKIIRDENSDKTSCRKWTFTFREHLDYKRNNKKNIFKNKPVDFFDFIASLGFTLMMVWLFIAGIFYTVELFG